MATGKLSLQEKKAEKRTKFMQLIADAKTPKDWQKIANKKNNFWSVELIEDYKNLWDWFAFKSKLFS